MSSSPSIFYDFIIDISIRTDVSDMYMIAGLEGLLIGGVNPYSLWTLTKRYLTVDFVQHNSYIFSRIAEYYIKEENKYIDEILNLCKKLVILPLIGIITC